MLLFLGLKANVLAKNVYSRSADEKKLLHPKSTGLADEGELGFMKSVEAQFEKIVVAKAKGAGEQTANLAIDSFHLSAGQTGVVKAQDSLGVAEEGFCRHLGGALWRRRQAGLQAAMKTPKTKYHRAVPAGQPFLQGPVFVNSLGQATIYVWCPYCRKQHIHGWDADAPHWAVAGRCAHCGPLSHYYIRQAPRLRVPSGYLLK